MKSPMLGEGHHLVEAFAHFAPRKAQQRGVDAHVLRAGQVGMKSRAQVQQRGDAAVHFHAALVRPA